MINQQTQNILNKYGVNNPVVQKELEQPTKHEITINNETKNINESVPANIGGPIQGRPIQFTNDVGKLKVWLSGKYAQQRELSRKRDEKYRRNELSLVRSTNKLMKKIEDANIRLGKNINPEKFGSKIGSQLRIMFLMLGIGQVTKSWPKIMEHLNGIGENSISIGKLFSKEGRQELRNTLRTKIVKSLGGKEGETVGEAFKKFFINTDENPGLFDLIKKKINNWIDIRADALGKVRKEHEEISHPVGDKILNKLGKHINRFSSFLGDFFSVFLSGDKAFGKIMSNKIRDNAQDATDFNPSNYSRDIKDIANPDHGIDIEKVKAITKIDNDEEAADKVQQGSSYLFTPYNYFADNKQWYRFVNNSSHFDLNKLTRNGGGKELIRKPEASIAQCDEICFHLRCCAEGKNIDAGSYYKFSYKNSISAIAYGISRLYHLSKNQGTIPVTCDFLYDILGDISKINVKPQRYVLKLVPLKNNDIYDSKNDSKDATYNKHLNLTDTAETYTYVLVKTDDETDVGDGTKAIYFFEVDPENLLKAINIFTESNLEDKEITTENSKYNIAILTAVGKRCKKKEDFEKAKDEIVSVFKISDEAREYGKQLEAEYQNYASQSRLEDLQNNWKEDYSKLEGSLEKAKESAVNKINATAGDLKEFVDINITPNSSKNNSTNEVEITEPIVNVADVKQRVEQSNIIKEGEEIINTIQNEINDLSKTKNDLQNEINDLSKTKDEIAVDESIPSQQPKQQQTAGNGKSYSSNNIPPYKGFNVEKAIDTLNRNTGKYLGNVKDSKTGKIIHKAGDQKDEYVSGHWCGKAVENALNAGGIQGSFGDAYMFVHSLPKHNFIQIPANSALLPGDIIVEMRTRKHPKGHVAMYNGQQWVSDYKQGNIWFRGLKGMTGEITLWRYNLTDTERESPASNNNNNNTSPNNTPNNNNNNNSTPSSPYLNIAAKSKEYSGLFDKKLNDSEKKKNWVKVLYEATKEKLKNKGFDERFTDILLSQWAFESNWGMNEAGAFNLGGIKASCSKVKGKKTPKDPSHAVLLNTTEYLNDTDNSKHGFPEVISIGYDNKRKKYKWKIKDYFKVFDSLGDFIDSKLKLVGETHKSLDVDPTISNYVDSIKSWGYFIGDKNSYIIGLTNRYNSIQKVKSENPNLSAEYNNNDDNKSKKSSSEDNSKSENDNYMYESEKQESYTPINISGKVTKEEAIKLTKQLLGNIYPFTYCPSLWNKTNNKTPQTGSIVLYYGETGKGVSRAYHTGYVIGVSNGIFYTIEGNTSPGSGERIEPNGGGVFKKQHSIYKLNNNTKFFIPDYNILIEAGLFSTVPEIIDRIITIATNELGYLEKKSNNNLDDKRANFASKSESGNYTKYWRDIAPKSNGNAWCACFITWIIRQAILTANPTNEKEKDSKVTDTGDFSLNEISTTNLGSDYIDVGIYFNLDKEVCRNIDIFAKRNPEEAKRLMDYINKDKSNVSKILKENNGFFSKEYFAKLSNIFNLKKLDNITYEKELGGIIDKEKYTPIKINKIIPTNTRNTKFNINLDNSTEAINNFSKIPTKLSLLNSILGITMKNIGDNIGATDNIGVSYVNSNPIIPNIPKSENLIK